MSKSKFNPLITASVMSAVCLAGVSHTSETYADTIVQAETYVSYAQTESISVPEANAQGQRRYIILLDEPSLANYSGVGRFAPIPRGPGNRLLSNSPAAVDYVNHLKQQQNDFLANVQSTLGRNADSIFTYQYALNGVVVEMDANEAAAVSRMAGVRSIELDVEYDLNTDAGPQLIGADNVWTGAAPASGTSFGEGMVVGILDSGANFDHPSFADVGDDGYDHTNPLGSGNYLGVCDVSNTEQYLASHTCNDKLIGGYDFVNAITPPDGTDIPGPEDENGHGTHVASTVAGNLVNGASVPGIIGMGDISGVARHANVMIFDVCYNPAPGAGGGCFGSAGAAAIDQILADGIVNAVNYSISGGNSPWSEAASLAFLSAVDSGVFVATSGGNSGPDAGTAGHVEPWTASSGASTHTRRINFPISITGPVVDPALQDLQYNGSNGPVVAADIAAGINYAGVVDPANFEGCNAFPAASFDGVVALISRGGCSFADKVLNAEAAGAIAVVIHNNAPGGLNMNVGDMTTVPSVSISQTDGQAMAAYIMANAGSTVLIAQPFLDPTTPDVMAGFSSRGPSPFEFNKPDVTAPGVQVLAGWADSDPATGTPAEFNIISGTSMASPHTAGAAALLKELHPTWTAPEIKSALMLTAVTAGVTKEDGVTPADAFDRGAGRIQVDVASSTGLVMNETAFRYLQADPANGGDPKTLNVASYKNDNCVGTCSFQRKFRSVAAGPVSYEASLTGMTGTVNPATFTAMPGQTITMNVEIDGAALTAGATSFGELVIEPVAPSNSFSVNPDNTAIPDAGYDGSLGSMACETIAVSGSGTPIDLAVELAVDHTWIGDLVVKLQNPDGDVLGLLSRPGYAEGADDGNTVDFGDSSNLLATSPLTYVDGAGTSAETMGDVGGTSAVVCQDDGVCEFAPAPDSVAQPPGTLADMIAGTNDGNWMLCVGDSGGGDTGEIDTVELKFITGAAPTEPALHMPLVVVGLPEQPDIDVTPASLSATLDADMTTDLNLNIANSPVAGADLNWTFGSGTYPAAFINQEDASGTLTNGFLSGTFAGNSGNGVFTADDFTLTEEASIESMQFDGFVNGSTIAAISTAIRVFIYADDSGVPMGHPEDGLNLEIASLNLPVADPSLDLTNNFINIDVVAANGGNPLVVPAGTYWITVVVDHTGAIGDTRWNWFAAGSDVAGGTTQVIGTNFGIPDWTGLPVFLDPDNPNFEQMRFNISGSAACGASWITTSVPGGAVTPGNGTDVTVTLDSTGLAPGVYEGALCIESDDPDEAQVVVPVTLTVDGPDDLIFANGFEAAP